MNWSDLATAIPAAVIAAVASAPNGLTSAANQVYVAEERRESSNNTEAWGRLDSESPEDLGAVLGGHLLGWDLVLRVGGNAATDAELQSWGQNLRAYFSGRLLTVTGLMAQNVIDQVFEEAPGEGVDRELKITIRFVSFEEPHVITAA